MFTWITKTKDGKTYEETLSKWNDIKDDIVSLEFIDRISNQTISLPPNMKEYFQAKTASADFTNENIRIESRYIQCKIGNNIVRIRVNETTGNISVEAE